MAKYDDKDKVPPSDLISIQIELVSGKRARKRFEWAFKSPNRLEAVIISNGKPCIVQ